MPVTEAAAARTSIGPAITDVAGEPADSRQLERLVARYHWAASYCDGRVVLEVACGTGQGLGLLRLRARGVYGCDLNRENLEGAHRWNGPGQPLAQANAQSLPFADQSVDVVILLEAIYFLPSADAFLAEAQRVLRPNGWCLVSAVNKDCPDFNPRHSLYRDLYGAPELSQLFRKHGLFPECFGIVPVGQPSLRSRAFHPVKRLAISLNLVPESKQARLLLKRIVFGRLQRMPHDVSTLPGPRAQPQAIAIDKPDLMHQVILCAGKRP